MLKLLKRSIDKILLVFVFIFVFLLTRNYTGSDIATFVMLSILNADRVEMKMRFSQHSEKL